MKLCGSFKLYEMVCGYSHFGLIATLLSPPWDLQPSLRKVELPNLINILLGSNYPSYPFVVESFFVYFIPILPV